MSKGPAGGQQGLREGCEEDRHIAPQDRAFSAVSQWATAEEIGSSAS